MLKKVFNKIQRFLHTTTSILSIMTIGGAGQRKDFF